MNTLLDILIVVALAILVYSVVRMVWLGVEIYRDVFGDEGCGALGITRPTSDDANMEGLE